MTRRRRPRAHRGLLGAGSLCLFLAGGALLAAPQTNRLGEAKGLYESAEYNQAYALLEGMDAAALTPELARERLLYQALCLLALENGTGADSKIRELVEADPLFLPQRDVPPRLLELISEARNRVLLRVAQDRYQLGKDHFEAGDQAAALREFTFVLQLVRQAEDEGSGNAAALADIRRLAEGFRDLSRRAPSAEPPRTSSELVPGREPGPALEAVVPPVVIRQEVPPWPRPVAAHLNRLGHGSLSGVLLIVIGKSGEVKTVTLVQRVHPAYDAQLVAAAKKWKYEPATLNGQSIEYLKRLTVRIAVK